jgi:ABC-2 type transport system permease protein
MSTGQHRVTVRPASASQQAQPAPQLVTTVAGAKAADGAAAGGVAAGRVTAGRVTAGEGSLRLALHAEWTKLRTVAGPAWLLLGLVALTIVVAAAATWATHCPPRLTCPVDPVKLSLTGIQLSQAVAALLAVLMVTSEYSSGMMRVTLAAMPRREVLLAAKAILLTALVLAAGAVAVFGSVLAGHLILPGHGFTAARGFHPVWLSYGPALRAACGSVLYLGLVALMSLGVAMIVRDSAVSTGAVLALLYLFPIVLSFIGNEHWQRRLERWTPTVAGLNIQDTTGLRNLVITPWSGLGVLAIWAAAALLAGALAFRFRDA